MNIIIMGCGKIGGDILANLVTEGHDVTAMDENAEVLSDLTNVYDVMTVCDSGLDYDTLTEAGVRDAELYLAMTQNDEVNIMSCFLARKMGAKHTVARISNPEYKGRGLAFIKQQANISMFINPDQVMAAEIFNTLKLPNGIRSEYFSKRNFEMIEMQVKEYSPLIGHKLFEIRNKIKAKFLVCVVRRGNEVFIPDGNFELKKGDMINLTASPSEVDKLLKACGYLEMEPVML
ncbi:MAG: NAD-binding protein [Firmicutes bacterium]|nr:NAD-binding protein [Bacillota bacterium]